MKITVWNLVTDKGVIKMNHIEDGWVDGDFPKPKKKEFVNQKGWEKLKWTKKYANLVNDVVVYI